MIAEWPEGSRKGERESKVSICSTVDAIRLGDEGERKEKQEWNRAFVISKNKQKQVRFPSLIDRQSCINECVKEKTKRAFGRNNGGVLPPEERIANCEEKKRIRNRARRFSTL